MQRLPLELAEGRDTIDPVQGSANQIHTGLSGSDQSLLACRKCRRLVKQLAKLRLSYPDYWNRPVPASLGSDASTINPIVDTLIVDTPILIVGLAPGMHGANKTGKPFVGDASGELLHATLKQLELQDKVIITNAVKCLPIKNLPNMKEVKNCSQYLVQELERHARQPTPVVFSLGGVAHRAVIGAMGLRQADYSFRHKAVHNLQKLTLVNSYHCSRYNTHTGRLTPAMFKSALAKAKALARL